MTSQFIYIRDYFQHLSIPERIKYAQGIGQTWIDLINRDDVFLDERDYNLYTVVKIGNREWLGENLRYDHPHSIINPDNPSIDYGRYYNRDTAIEVAPDGFELPSDKDFESFDYKGDIYPGYFEDSFEDVNNFIDLWSKSKRNENFIYYYKENDISTKLTGEVSTITKDEWYFSCRYIKSI